MKVLVVGAGAVGQVVAHHLAAGGAEVEFYVKPAYALWHDRHAMLLQQLSFVPCVRARARGCEARATRVSPTHAHTPVFLVGRAGAASSR